MTQELARAERDKIQAYVAQLNRRAVLQVWAAIVAYAAIAPIVFFAMPEFRP